MWRALDEREHSTRQEQEVGSFLKKLTETIESRVEPDRYIDEEAGHNVIVPLGILQSASPLEYVQQL